MKTSTFAGVLLLCLIITPLANAQVAPTMVATEVVICKDVVDRTPVDPGTTFSASVGQLYCFTKVLGAEGLTEVTHVWYFGNEERAKITLPVRSPSWRTFSSKKIRPNEAGQWFIDVVSADGQVLQTIQFKITP